MRIISGTLGGRIIQPPTNMPHTRPTTDIAKEGLFNIIQNNIEIEGIKTLDIFGGTGSISYELFSRGAADLTIVEKDVKMSAFIEKTAAMLNITTLKCVKMDVFSFLANCNEQYNFIFAGPPYALHTIDELPKMIIDRKLLQPNGWFVLEHTPRNDYSGYEKFIQQRNYGTTVFSFFINRDK